MFYKEELAEALQILQNDTIRKQKKRLHLVMFRNKCDEKNTSESGNFKMKEEEFSGGLKKKTVGGEERDKKESKANRGGRSRNGSKNSNREMPDLRR